MDKPTMHMLSVEEKGGYTRKTTQFVAAVAAAIGAVIAGTILAWTSPALPQLETPVNLTLTLIKYNLTHLPPNVTAKLNAAGQVADLLLDTKESSLVSSVLAIGAAVGALPTGVIVERIGRRPTILMLLVPFMLNWLLTIFANTDCFSSSRIQISCVIGSLVSSVLAIGAAVGALPTGVIAERIGRRPTILMLSVPFMLNWLLTIFANGAGMLIAARFFAGFSTGGICVAAPMYIGEIAETSIRGALGAFFQLFLTVGILMTFIIGGWTHWRVLSIVSAVLPPLLVVVFWFMPETPQYLLGKNRRRDAEKSLRWLRGPDADLSGELEDMQKDIDAAARQKAGMLSMVTNRTSLMALICSLGLMLFQQFSGINAVIFYTNNIFRSAGSDIDPVIATIIVGVVQTIATIISSVLIDKAGRRILLIQSCIIMGICLIVLGIYFKLKDDGFNVASIGWLPLLCLVLFIISFSLGFGPIPWMMMAELFSVEFRGTASGIAVVFNWCLVFIVTMCFPLMKDAIGIYSCFWFFAGFMIVCFFFVVFLIPETKGKTNSQIQAILAGRRG